MTTIGTVNTANDIAPTTGPITISGSQLGGVDRVVLSPRISSSSTPSVTTDAPFTNQTNDSLQFSTQQALKAGTYDVAAFENGERLASLSNGLNILPNPGTSPVPQPPIRPSPPPPTGPSGRVAYEQLLQNPAQFLAQNEVRAKKLGLQNSGIQQFCIYAGHDTLNGNPVYEIITGTRSENQKKKQFSGMDLYQFSAFGLAITPDDVSGILPKGAKPPPTNLPLTKLPGSHGDMLMVTEQLTGCTIVAQKSGKNKHDKPCGPYILHVQPQSDKRMGIELEKQLKGAQFAGTGLPTILYGPKQYWKKASTNISVNQANYIGVKKDGCWMTYQQSFQNQPNPGSPPTRIIKPITETKLGYSY